MEPKTVNVALTIMGGGDVVCLCYEADKDLLENLEVYRGKDSHLYLAGTKQKVIDRLLGRAGKWKGKYITYLLSPVDFRTDRWMVGDRSLVKRIADRRRELQEGRVYGIGRRLQPRYRTLAEPFEYQAVVQAWKLTGADRKLEKVRGPWLPTISQARKNRLKLERQLFGRALPDSMFSQKAQDMDPAGYSPFFVEPKKDILGTITKTEIIGAQYHITVKADYSDTYSNHTIPLDQLESRINLFSHWAGTQVLLSEIESNAVPLAGLKISFDIKKCCKTDIKGTIRDHFYAVNLQKRMIK